MQPEMTIDDLIASLRSSNLSAPPPTVPTDFGAGTRGGAMRASMFLRPPVTGTPTSITTVGGGPAMVGPEVMLGQEFQAMRPNVTGQPFAETGVPRNPTQRAAATVMERLGVQEGQKISAKQAAKLAKQAKTVGRTVLAEASEVVAPKVMRAASSVGAAIDGPAALKVAEKVGEHAVKKFGAKAAVAGAGRVVGGLLGGPVGWALIGWSILQEVDEALLGDVIPELLDIPSLVTEGKRRNKGAGEERASIDSMLAAVYGERRQAGAEVERRLATQEGLSGVIGGLEAAKDRRIAMGAARGGEGLLTRGLAVDLLGPELAGLSIQQDPSIEEVAAGLGVSL